MCSESSRQSLAAIIYQTGPDESFLVGTEQQLRALAHGILDQIEAARGSREVWGVSVKESGGRLTELWGDACVDGMFVTKSERDTKKLVNELRKNSGEPPIAAEGWPL